MIIVLHRPIKYEHLIFHMDTIPLKMYQVNQKKNESNLVFNKLYYFFLALTKTQIKVIITVVIIISFIMLIIGIFRFK
jgi:hypothetical protein